MLSMEKGTILYDSKQKGTDLKIRIGESRIPTKLTNAIIGLPATRATVSFITFYTNIIDTFSKIKNFVPSTLPIKGSDPVIITFNLSVYKPKQK